jgi:hypothetical protein
MRHSPTLVQAKRTQLYTCDDSKCKCVHILLFGNHNFPEVSDEVITASAALPIERVASFIEELQKAAYMVAATKDET